MKSFAPMADDMPAPAKGRRRRRDKATGDMAPNRLDQKPRRQTMSPSLMDPIPAAPPPPTKPVPLDLGPKLGKLPTAAPQESSPLGEDEGMMKKGGKLTAAARHRLPSSDFALPGGRYPIEDANHARNALSRVSQNGSPAEKAKVRSAVHSKYPDIGQK